MWSQTTLFLLVVAYAYGAVSFYPVEIGEDVFLELGNDVKTWKRVRKEDVDEFIQYCGPTEKGPRCGGFVTADNKKAVPETDAHVFENGTLLIRSMKATDVGLYSSPDQKPFVKTLPDGSQSSTLRNHISLIIKE